MNCNSLGIIGIYVILTMILSSDRIVENMICF